MLDRQERIRYNKLTLLADMINQNVEGITKAKYDVHREVVSLGCPYEIEYNNYSDYYVHENQMENKHDTFTQERVLVAEDMAEVIMYLRWIDLKQGAGQGDI